MSTFSNQNHPLGGSVGDRRVIPTEPIGSIPRPPELIQALASYQAGKIARDVLDDAYSEALRDTIDRLEQTGSPVLTDGEQTKPNFATYPLTDSRILRLTKS
jgi:5-methyltetrahydropteroyltriglutamate--homocysteine methyltransferase